MLRTHRSCRAVDDSAHFILHGVTERREEGNWHWDEGLPRGLRIMTAARAFWATRSRSMARRRREECELQGLTRRAPVSGCGRSPSLNEQPPHLLQGAR